MAKFIKIDSIDIDTISDTCTGLTEEAWINTEMIASFQECVERGHSMTTIAYIANGRGAQIYAREHHEHLAMRINEL